MLLSQELQAWQPDGDSCQGEVPGPSGAAPFPPRPRPEAYLLCPAFIGSLVLVVNPAEVGNNHRNWQGNDQDTTQGADGAKDFPGNCLGHHVSISERERNRCKEGGPLGLPCQSFTDAFIH